MILVTFLIREKERKNNKLNYLNMVGEKINKFFAMVDTGTRVCPSVCLPWSKTRKC